VHPSRPAEQHDVPDVSSSPFRAAIGRARIEALAATTGGAAAGAERAFEYRLLRRAGKRSAEEARWNALGRAGWELVGVTAKHAAFKRPV
jgi:hypothetical protein